MCGKQVGGGVPTERVARRQGPVVAFFLTPTDAGEGDRDGVSRPPIASNVISVACRHVPFCIYNSGGNDFY